MEKNMETTQTTRVNLFDTTAPTWMKLSDVLNHLLRQDRFYDSQRIAQAFPDRGIRWNLTTTAPDYGYTVAGLDVIDFEEVKKFFPGNPIRIKTLRSHVTRYAY